MVDFRLRSFLEVWRQKSFTKAANALHVTQPAISQHIRYLEEELGHPLLVQKGRALTLTSEGETLLRFAEMVEAESLRTRERIAVLPTHERLCFGATRTIGEFVMPDLVARWARERPNSMISLRVDNSEALFAALRSGELDFLFVEGIFDRSAYVTDLLFRDDMIAVCAPGHQLAGTIIDIDRLFSETLIVREEGSGSRLLIEHAFAATNHAISSFARVMTIGNIGAIKDIVASSMGVALLYKSSVARDLSEGALASFRVEGLAIAHDFTFVCQKASPYEPEFRQFLTFCRHNLRAPTQGPQ